MGEVKLSKRAQMVQPFHVMDLLAQAQTLEKEGKPVVHLAAGEPDFGTPQAVLQAGIEALEAGDTFYTHAAGLMELRLAISHYYLQRFEVEVPVERIIVTSGASGALLLMLSLVADAGQKLALPDPDYPCNRQFASAVGVDTYRVPLHSAKDFVLDADELRANWQENTAALLLASPSNPTGNVMNNEQFAQVLAVCEANAAHLVVDELYQGINYDCAAQTVLSMSQNLWVVNSFSKYFGMTGWRLGWLVVPEGAQAAANSFAQHLFISPSTVAQRAALRLFEDDVQQELEARRKIMQQRRDYLLEQLPALGFKILGQPNGAFYLYADISSICNDSQVFCLELLSKTYIAMTPGIDFEESAVKARQRVRIAYAADISQLRVAVARLREYLA